MVSSARTGSNQSFDCVVIGAGVVGASVAQRLARSGVRVAVLDQAPEIGGGCSYANGALLAPGHVSPLATPALLREAPVQMLRRPPAVRLDPDLTLVGWMSKLLASAAPRRASIAQARMRDLAIQSTELHRALADCGLNPTMRKTGAIDVYLRSPRMNNKKLLSYKELQDFEPTLAPVEGGTHDTEEWTLESRSFVKSMLGDAARHGAEMMFGTPVKELLTRGSRVVGVRTPTGTILSENVVLAAGLHSAALAAQVGVRLPLRGGRGYVVDLAARPGSDPTLPVRIKEHRILVTPLEDRVRVCGSIEFGKEYRPVDPRRGNALVKVASSVLPSLRDRPIVDRWAGERPCTSDGVPLIGVAQGVRNLAIATGHGMWGLILAPITANLIADHLVAHSPTRAGAEWLRPDRFTRQVDKGSGSRESAKELA
ncbi:NAD(P)/FAD-dependent oxidoreductase [Streptomyces sp. NPDC017964]|uniref:NAD(P)/FAD-dependent oxidoreductase n=1 Tax=Streptomyces sp. NPDC017964 TaxID=3365022 RepID=UPI0037AD93CA